MKIRDFFNFKKSKVIQVKGAHCGCCGKFLPNSVVDNDWRWDICDKCS